MLATVSLFQAATTARHCSASATRLFATVGGSKKSGSSMAEPSYFYAPPGSSMREPVYISLSDPVYFYDAGKSSLSDALPPVDQKVPSSAPPRQSKLPLLALMGAEPQQQAASQSSKPHPYRLVDDMANQPYTISNRNSMREPKYVSMGEPIYIVDPKPTH